jgi:Tfp pilus assembly protein PilF
LTLLATRGPGLRDAAAAFQNAVKIDPQYADAWGALAEVQALLPDYALDTIQASYPSALAEARHALALNPDLASAYVAQGMVYKNQWRWPEADQAFRRAVSLAPGDAEAVNQYAQFLMTAGQFNPALAEIERAQRLDPLSASIGTTRAYLLRILHQYQAASAQLHDTLALHPDFVSARDNAVEVAVIHHDYPEAERQARLMAVLVGVTPDVMSKLMSGIANPAMRPGGVQSLDDPGTTGLTHDPLFYAGWLAMLGADDRALTVLERAAVQRTSANPETIWDPVFDPIRNDPRFKAVLKKMGLPYTPASVAKP